MFGLIIQALVVLSTPVPGSVKCPSTVTCVATRYDLNFGKVQCALGCFANGCLIYSPNRTPMLKC